MESIKDNNGVLEMPNDPKYEPDPRGYGVHCFYKMKEFSDDIAQINVETNKSETYGEILIKSIRVALQIKAIGIQETDIISLCTDTHSETCLPMWAAAFSGIKIANLDPTLTLNDMEYLSGLTKPKLIFCIPESIEYLEIVIKKLNLNTKLVVFGETKTHIPFKQFLKPQDGEQDFKPKIAENIFDTISILFSSGTTGLPKGVCVTHYGLLSMMYMCKDIFDMETVLFYTSPYWISYILFLSSTVATGGKRILSKTFNASDVLKLIQTYKITYLFLPPTYVYAVTSQTGIDHETYDTSNLHAMLVGGGNIASEQIMRIRDLLPNTYINNCYGLTEITCLFSAFNPKTDSEMLQTKVGSCGKMLNDTSCKVVDIETNEVLGKYQKGELLIKTKRIMKGYYNDPQKTTEAFDEDGFLHTGDIVYYDDDYYFYVVDRIKEMFKYKSWHIVPAELENIILKHPAVKEVLVIGYPNEEDGDHPMAVIILKEDFTVSENDILEYFNDQVSDRKKLRGGIKFVKNLPKTTTHKFNRIKLRSMVINNEI